MTLGWIREEIERIKANPDDPETQGAIKDELYVAVLKTIAAGEYSDVGDQPDAFELAEAALEAEKISVKWGARA